MVELVELTELAGFVVLVDSVGLVDLEGNGEMKTKRVADLEGIVADLEGAVSAPDDLEGRVLAVARRAEMVPDVKEVVAETDVAEVMTLDVEEVTETDVEEVTTPDVEAAAWDGIAAALAAWEGMEKGGVWR